MNILMVTKFVLGSAASAGTGLLVGKLCRMLMPDSDSKIKVYLALFGGFVLAAKAGNMTAEFVEEMVDSVVAITNVTMFKRKR